MDKKSEYSYRTFVDDDTTAVMNLVHKAFPSFLGGNYWVWKYLSNPNFDPALVVIAEKDGEVVGCNHWLLRNFKLTNELTVKASLGGDIVVAPQHRGQGVGKGLLKFLRSSKTFNEKGIILTYMFADPKLNKRLYKPAVGYVFAPDSTTVYSKYLNTRRMKERFLKINEVLRSKPDLQNELEGLTLRMMFRLRGSPIFSIVLSSNQVDFVEGELENADVIIEGDFPLFSNVVEGLIGLDLLVKSLLMRKLRVKKGKLKIFKLFKVLKTFKTALSTVND